MCIRDRAVADGLSEEEAALSTLNPSEADTANCEFFHDVSDCMSLYEGVWMEIRLA